MFRCVRLALIVFMWLAIIPSAAYAQASLAGTVRDASGGVLPGVTVEITSPALIEKVRSNVTDGTGQYRFENLRPGPYVMTFTLPGFATVKREGVELTGTATATVNVELRVGAVEETITVTGEAPVVDVQNTTRQTVLDQQILDAIPASRSVFLLSATLPGVTRPTEDVGGLTGDGASRGSQTARGNDDTRVLAGGLGLHSATGQNSGIVTAMNLAMYQEVAVDTGGISAENAEGGVIINLIPRDGGNTFGGKIFTNFANHSMQANNFTQELKDRGLGTPNTMNKLWEFNPAFGGPIKRDRVWFQWSARSAGAYQNVPMFYNKNAGDATKWTYEPDTNRPAGNQNKVTDFSSVRVTWQANPKHKFAGNYSRSTVDDHPRGLTATSSPEANANNYSGARRTGFGGEWTAPLTSNFLLEAAFGSVSIYWPRPHPGENPFLPPGTVGMIAAQEQSTGIRYRASTGNFETRDNRVSWRIALSHVTGSQAFKAGFTFGAGRLDRSEYNIDAPLLFRFNNGAPNQITQEARGVLLRTHLDADHGIFVQDKWTIGRLTLSGGLRADLMSISYPEIRVGPAQFAPARNVVFPRTQGLQWKEISPRSGLAYDVFGDGKTALKVSLNRYVAAMEVGSGDLVEITRGPAPAALLVSSTTRSWNDANGNFVPDCNLLSTAANGECGAMANPDFGSTRAGTTYDPDLLKGWNLRPSNWQFEVAVQREILPRISINAGYWRSWMGNFFATDNRTTGPVDFEPFSITAPVDPRLPGGGGYTISGLYDIKPAKFGLPADNFFTAAKNYGKQTEVWNGVDLTVNARPGPGMFVSGGTSTQRRATNNCEVVAKLDNPSPLFCDVKGTFLTSIKFLASYTVPRIDVQVTGNFQNLPGPEITADYVASSAQVQPSLGRPLAGGARNVTVPLIEPRSMYGDRMTRLDVRVGKILHFGRVRATPSVDVYNMLNASTALGQSSAYATWLRPQSIIPGRFAKVGVQLDF
jgi:hypothetical protein